MKTQIVYVVISSEDDLFLEELWVSLFSLRIYHPEATVKVLVDAPTAERIHQRPALDKMINEVVTVEVPEEYNAKCKSRQIKTTIREVISGSYLYIDTDTVIAHSLEEIDNIQCDIAAVPDCHLPLSLHPFGNSQIQNVRRVFDIDVSDAKFLFNGGVMYVADTKQTHELYKRWNENWKYSANTKKHTDDQPALIKANKEMGYIIQELPAVFNCQLALSLQYLHEAYIVHFFHMGFIPDQSYSPFMGLDIYREVKEAGGITDHAEMLIRNCKSAFETPTMAVGKSQIYFLFSPTGQAFTMLRERNQSCAKFLDWLGVKIIKYYRAKRKLKEKFNHNK